MIIVVTTIPELKQNVQAIQVTSLSSLSQPLSGLKENNVQTVQVTSSLLSQPLPGFMQNVELTHVRHLNYLQSPDSRRY